MAIGVGALVNRCNIILVRACNSQWSASFFNGDQQIATQSIGCIKAYIYSTIHPGGSATATHLHNQQSKRSSTNPEPFTHSRHSTSHTTNSTHPSRLTSTEGRCAKKLDGPSKRAITRAAGASNTAPTRRAPTISTSKAFQDHLGRSCAPQSRPLTGRLQDIALRAGSGLTERRMKRRLLPLLVTKGVGEWGSANARFFC